MHSRGIDFHPHQCVTKRAPLPACRGKANLYPFWSAFSGREAENDPQIVERKTRQGPCKALLNTITQMSVSFSHGLENSSGMHHLQGDACQPQVQETLSPVCPWWREPSGTLRPFAQRLGGTDSALSPSQPGPAPGDPPEARRPFVCVCVIPTSLCPIPTGTCHVQADSILPYWQHRPFYTQARLHAPLPLPPRLGRQGFLLWQLLWCPLLLEKKAPKDILKAGLATWASPKLGGKKHPKRAGFPVDPKRWLPFGC